MRRYIILTAGIVMLSLNIFAQRARGGESSVVPDSVLATTSSIAADSSLVASSDSIPNDSVSKKRDELEAPVIYQSKDSMVDRKSTRLNSSHA